METDWPDQDEYEVRVYDERHGRRLVAAIKLVSPGNKDRPESRGFPSSPRWPRFCRMTSVSRWLTWLPFGNSISMAMCWSSSVGQTWLPASKTRSCTRRRCVGASGCARRSLLDAWFYPMIVGQPLPALPVWLDVDLRLMLELEASYEETCRLLRIA